MAGIFPPFAAHVKTTVDQRFLSLIAAVVLPALVSSRAAAPEPDHAGVEFFEKKIRPIFVEHCYQCHSKDAEKVKGGLLLDTREGLLKGGDTGPALVAGDPEKSLLIKAVRYTDEDLQMPPRKGGGKKLAAKEIADLELWVKMGAPDPRITKTTESLKVETITAKARTHWAYQSLKLPSIPVVRNSRWVQTPVDAF